MKDVKAGKIEFDVAIATPAVMPKIAVLGKELGPKGLMPNPKNGTVTDDVASAVSEYKKGKQTFACDDSGVHSYECW
jgi:large subunit ribosomal protein L1